MMTKFRRIFSPVWSYLRQPILDQAQPITWSPKRFWRQYQVEFLERCWLHVSPSSHHPLS